jgi:hypothetical protein
LTDRKRFFDLATDLVKAEGDNWAGRTNMLGLVAIFVILFVPATVFDIVQVGVRLWDEEYETGLPSILSIVWTYGYLLLACVLMLVTSEVVRTFARRDNSEDS